MSATAVFSPRVMLIWIVAAAVAFGLLIYFMAFGGGPRRDVAGPSAYSRSAVGFAGWAELIGRIGVTVVKVRNGGVDSSALGKLLVIADPNATPEDEKSGLYGLGDANRVLVILPKWQGYRNTNRPGWIVDASLIPAGFVDQVIRKTGATGKTARVELPENWTTNTLGAAPELTAPLQVIDDTKLRPVIAVDSHVLVGELAEHNRRLWIVADPDMLSNHGLFKGHNAEFSVRLINALRPVRGAVAFNESTAGPGAAPPTANALAAMLQFPFVVVTIQLLAAAALLLWAATPRFGLPVPAPEMLAAGKQRLIRNAAALLRYSNHPEVIITSYVRLSVRAVARELHAPPGLDWRKMIDWLARVGGSRAVAVDLEGLVRRAEDLATARAGSARTLVEIVQDTHRWKREILNGP